MKLYYAGKPGNGFGWGVCNTNLIRQLRKLCDLKVSGSSDQDHWDGPVFMPLANQTFAPVSPVRGSFNMAYTFFESPLGPEAAENAAKFDVVFCGSTWCLKRMEERGITNGEVLVQGVDHTMFRPRAPRLKDGVLRVFSGGKLEWRKGHDIVIEAFGRIDSKWRAQLVAEWANLWPATAQSLHGLIDENIIEAWTTRAPCPQQVLASVMHATDIGVFPNRCEGGTNLVLMEYLACGKPAIVSRGTGHLDIITEDNCIPLAGEEDANHWVHVKADQIVGAVERAMNFAPIRNAMSKWTWQRAAQQIMRHIT